MVLGASIIERLQELVGGVNPVFTMASSMVLLAALPVVLTMWVTMRRPNKSETDDKGAKEEEEASAKTPSHYGNLTKEELKAYTGKDPTKPLIVGIKGKLYDVTSGSDFYGPGGPYNLFTGIDASRALAKMSFKPEDLEGEIDDLSQSEKDILFDWEQKFKMKYKYVGDIVD